MKKYIVLALVLFLAFSSLPINLKVAYSAEMDKRMVTIVILLDFSTFEYDNFYAWFNTLPITNYTFVLTNWRSLNATQVNWLQSKAELIPLVGWLQLYEPAKRLSSIDTTLSNRLSS